MCPSQKECGEVQWAGVELFRHQYGELPRDDDTRKIDYPKAMRLMASGIEASDVSTTNAAIVMRVMALRIENLEKRLRDVGQKP